MARRRSKKNRDFEIVKVVVFGFFLLLFLYTKNIETTLQLGLKIIVSVVVAGACIALIIYLLIKRKKQIQSPHQPGSTTKSRSKGVSSVATGPDKSYDHKNSEQSHNNKTLSEKIIESEGLGQVPRHDSQIQVKPDEWSIDLIKSLDWKYFEELCAGYFQAKGHDAKVTSIGADGGIDVLLYGKNNPDKVLGVVQCKAWSQKPVGVKEVRELLGIMTDKGCPLGVYWTTSGYTPEAKKFAEGKHISLMDAEQLLDLISKLPEDTQSELLTKITTGDYTTPSCPSCDTKLVSRVSRKGNQAGNSFWGCPNFPKCRYTMRQSRQ